jgi:hypothetical protein
MHVGMTTFFQNIGHAMSDAAVYAHEMSMADLAEPLGFDSLWSAEHHFDDYTMCPSVAQFLSYMAGRTPQGEARLHGDGAALARPGPTRRGGLGT